MSEQPQPAIGQIWKEVDPRFERFVCILDVYESDGCVLIQNFAHAGVRVWVKALRARKRCAAIERFNGKARGYKFIEEKAS